MSEIVKSISYFSDFKNENQFVSRKGLCTFPDLSRVCFNIHLIENLKGSKVEMCIHFITETLCPSYLQKMAVTVEWVGGELNKWLYVNTSSLNKQTTGKINWLDSSDKVRERCKFQVQVRHKFINIWIWEKKSDITYSQYEINWPRYALDKLNHPPPTRTEVTSFSINNCDDK